MTYDEAFELQKGYKLPKPKWKYVSSTMGMSKNKSEEYSYQRDFVVICMQRFRTENKIVYI